MLSIINFFCLIFDKILLTKFISTNWTELKYFLKDGDILFKSQKNLISLFLFIKT